MRNVDFGKLESVWSLSRKYWFHFLSLVSIVVFMMLGYSPVLSVFWATVVSFVTSFLRSDTALFSYDLFRGKGSLSDHVFQSPFVKAMYRRLDRRAQRRARRAPAPASSSASSRSPAWG